MKRLHPAAEKTATVESQGKNHSDQKPLLADALSLIFAVAVAFALFAGYRLRHLELTTPEHGIGYGLGIGGATLMFLLLLYPLRKRIRGAAFLGSNRFWFRFHMIAGLLGPLLILYHANFSLGSTNSNVALFCMLIVAGSGLIGRYIYAKIHHGLYGSKASLAELRRSLDSSRDEISALFSLSPGLRDELFDFSERAIETPDNIFKSLVRMVTVRLDAMRTRRRVYRIVRHDIVEKSQRAHWSRAEVRRLMRHADARSRVFISHAKAIAEFSLFEQLFSFWHVLHLPLFFMLVIAAIVHVIAVHFY